MAAIGESQKLVIESENSAGVLRRVAGVLSRKGHNIYSLHSDPSGTPNRSIMEIVVECSLEEARIMQKQLMRLYDVYQVDIYCQGT